LTPARLYAQIAIFVLPVVCLVGWATKHAFTLDLDPLSIIILTLSVIHACATGSLLCIQWRTSCLLAGHGVCSCLLP